MLTGVSDFTRVFSMVEAVVQWDPWVLEILDNPIMPFIVSMPIMYT